MKFKIKLLRDLPYGAKELWLRCECKLKEVPELESSGKKFFHPIYIGSSDCFACKSFIGYDKDTNELECSSYSREPENYLD